MKKFELPIKIESVIYRKKENRVEFLALKRSLEDGGFWQPITGTLESNESLEECLLREAQEEIGVSLENVISVSGLLHSFTWEKKNIGVMNEYIFAVEIKLDSVVELSSEHTEFKWCTQEEAELLFSMENNKIGLRKTIEYLNS